MIFVWTVGDLIGAALAVVFLLAVVIHFLAQWFDQASCRHSRYYENSACDAICRDCGKNLGFIGNLGDKQ